MTGYQPDPNNLSVSYFNALLYNLLYLRRPSFGYTCGTTYVQPELQRLCQTAPIPFPTQPDLYYNSINNNRNNNNFIARPRVWP